MIIYGAGGHGKVLLDMALCSGITTEVLYADDRPINFFNGVGVINTAQIPSGESMIIAIGDNIIRKIKAACFAEHPFATIIHPGAIVSKSASLGSGTAVMPGVVINTDSTIGNHVIVNTNCSIDHDCTIQDFVHISPNAALAGNVEIGEGTHVGIGVNIIQGIKIGKWATLGAGTVIIKDIPDYAVVVGNPGKIIKYNKLSNG